jgi:Rrf2 family nitric oxide-sensitive transcriptional repressor
MQLTLHTDYGLRALMFLAHAGRRCSTSAMAEAYDISRDHLVKVIQHLAELGLVKTFAGRGGGVELARDPVSIDVGDVAASLEGANGVLECISDPSVCVLEPGCRLRRKLISAERAFFDTLRGTTLADLVETPRPGRGVARLAVLPN